MDNIIFDFSVFDLWPFFLVRFILSDPERMAPDDPWREFEQKESEIKRSNPNNSSGK